MELFRALDHGTYSFFQNQVRWLHPYFTGLVFLGSPWLATALVLLGVLLFLLNRRRNTAFITLTVYLIGVALSQAVAHSVPRARPSDAMEILGPTSGSSFPAIDALLSTYAWTVVAWGLADLAPARKSVLAYILVFAASAVLIALECLVQLMLSLHFLTDVLAGLAGGGAMALLARHFASAPSGASSQPRGV